MKTGHLLRVTTTLALLLLLIPLDSASAQSTNSLPPVDMFQLPWEQGSSWVALDGFDNGFKRLLNSPHFYLNGGAVDFAPHNNMWIGEDTSQDWVTAAAAGTVVELSSCHLKIDHGNGWITEYQFLANIQVRLGQAVSRNQRLAVIANGRTQPFCPPSLEPDIPHLHFSLRPDMRGATFSGWVINYNPLLNQTTFTKDGQTLGSYQPLLNMPNLQVSLRDPITWDTIYIGSVDATRHERWPFTLNVPTSFILAATPISGNLVPLLVLLDANGNELARAVGTLKSTQPAGNYFVEVQSQSGNGFYNLTLRKDTTPVPTPGGPSVSTNLTPASISVGQVATATVDLNEVPVDGYKSAEFTCSYDTSLAKVSNIAEAGLFGADAVVAINGPQNGSFIFAIAGSNGQKASTSGAAFTFNLTGLQAGQTAIECKARISKGDNVLTPLPSTPSNLTVLGSNPTPAPTFNPTSTSVISTPISPTSNGLTPVPPTETPTPEPVTTGTFTGKVVASKPVTISLYNADNSLATSATANPDGTFSLTAPAGTYTAVASATGFLNAQGSVTLTTGATSTLPSISLPAGDIDGNHVIDQFDAMTIGMGYNTDTPAAADLNGDGVINVLDLELLAANYRKSGALAWK
jgi:hypothetical protein